MLTWCIISSILLVISVWYGINMTRKWLYAEKKLGKFNQSCLDKYNKRK